MDHEFDKISRVGLTLISVFKFLSWIIFYIFVLPIFNT